MASRCLHEKRQCQFLGKGSPIVKHRDFLLWTVEKWLNRLICPLDCGLGWADGSTSSIILARWCQCAHMGGHIGATWQIRLNHLSVVAMRSYVKLLWQLVVIMVTVEKQILEWLEVQIFVYNANRLVFVDCIKMLEKKWTSTWTKIQSCICVHLQQLNISRPRTGNRNCVIDWKI